MAAYFENAGTMNLPRWTSVAEGRALTAQTELLEKQVEQADDILDIKLREIAEKEAEETRLAEAAQADAKKAAYEAERQAVADAYYMKQGGASAELATKRLKDNLAAIDEEYGTSALAEFKGSFGAFFDDDEWEQIGSVVTEGESLEQTGQTSVLSLEEKLGLGMPQEWAENAVVEKDEEGNLTVNNRPTGMTAEDLTARGGVNKAGVSANTIEFQNNVIGAVGAIQTGTELLIASAESPEALGVPGGFMRFGSNLVSGAKAIADWAGYAELSQNETELQTIGASAFNYDSVDTDKLGISGAEAEKFRAGIYGIAFAAAVAEQGTRPTDKDIQQFIDQIGGRATSAQSFRETIVQFMRRQDRRLEAIAAVKQIGAVDREAAFSSWKPAYRKFMQTYAEISGKRTATNPDTGEKLIEINPDEWEAY